VRADLEALAIALYVKVDDDLKTRPELVKPRPPAGFAPKLSDAETTRRGQPTSRSLIAYDH
jgi:hypothetical protein